MYFIFLPSVAAFLLILIASLAPLFMFKTMQKSMLEQVEEARKAWRPEDREKNSAVCLVYQVPRQPATEPGIG